MGGHAMGYVHQAFSVDVAQFFIGGEFERG
jgi:hypothetical protein